MEDPEPLERVARGVPAAFAAIVRKLMAKNPDDRYQTCAELRADLARWTDPERRPGDPRRRGRGGPLVPSSAAPDRGRGPASPVDAEDESPIVLSLRDLGDAEPSLPPATAPPSAPGRIGRPRAPLDSRQSQPGGDSRWLIHFSLVVLGLGLVAILMIALLLRG